MNGKPPFPCGGRHWESAAMANLLRHSGVVCPATGAPYTEAMLFGLAGGIGAGYQFCPSVLKYNLGAGITIVGQHRAWATDASFIENGLRRIGARTQIHESAAPTKAFAALRDLLAAGRAAIAWTGRCELPYLSEVASCGGLWMYTVVVWRIDEATGTATVGDCAPEPLTISLDELAAARGAVCSHRNRLLTCDPPDEPADMAASIREAIAETIAGQKTPKIKTFSLESLGEWAKIIDNNKSAKGWRRTYPGALLYSALRDVFETIETIGTGGGLFRGMYAEFLREAADATGIAALEECAREYDALGRAWSELAGAALPDTVPEFKQTKTLLIRKRELFEKGGRNWREKTATIAAELRAIQAKMSAAKATPLDEKALHELLAGLRERIELLYQSEWRALRMLEEALQGSH